MPTLNEAVDSLKSSDSLNEFPIYPDGFQVAEFPKIAKEVRITGNNQAFFFAKPVTEEVEIEGVKKKKVVDIEPDTSKLKALIKNIYESGKNPDERTKFHLQIDNDVFANPELFVDKYESLRGETNEAQRRALLAKEVDIIRNFVETGGIKELVKDVIMESNSAKPDRSEDEPPLTRVAADLLATNFLANNFKLEGVTVGEPGLGDKLQAATWEVKLKDDSVLIARQNYSKGTNNTDRSWLIGMEEKVKELSAAGNAQATPEVNAVASKATMLLDEVEHTSHMDICDLTRGSRDRSSERQRNSGPSL